MTMLECLMLDFQKIMSWKLWINYDSRHVQRRMDRQSEETGAFPYGRCEFFSVNSDLL